MDHPGKFDSAADNFGEAIPVGLKIGQALVRFLLVIPLIVIRL